jgi:hypothetical protein
MAETRLTKIDAQWLTPKEWAIGLTPFLGVYLTLLPKIQIPMPRLRRIWAVQIVSTLLLIGVFPWFWSVAVGHSLGNLFSILFVPNPEKQKALPEGE